MPEARLTLAEVVEQYRSPSSLRIDVACNDPDNGLFAHKAVMFAIHEPVFSLSTRRGEALRFVEKSGHVRICRRDWPVRRSREWVGNWCWNSYWFPWSIGIGLLAAIHKTDKYGCDEAASSLYDLWEAGAFDRDTFAACLARELREDV